MENKNFEVTEPGCERKAVAGDAPSTKGKAEASSTQFRSKRYHCSECGRNWYSTSSHEAFCSFCRSKSIVTEG